MFSLLCSLINLTILWSSSFIRWKRKTKYKGKLWNIGNIYLDYSTVGIKVKNLKINLQPFFKTKKYYDINVFELFYMVVCQLPNYWANKRILFLNLKNNNNNFIIFSELLFSIRNNNNTWFTTILCKSQNQGKSIR